METERYSESYSVAKPTLYEKVQELLAITKSAESLWSFMAGDMSLSADERIAARRMYARAKSAIANCQV